MTSTHGKVKAVIELSVLITNVIPQFHPKIYYNVSMKIKGTRCGHLRTANPTFYEVVVSRPPAYTPHLTTFSTGPLIRRPEY